MSVQHTQLSMFICQADDRCGKSGYALRNVKQPGSDFVQAQRGAQDTAGFMHGDQRAKAAVKPLFYLLVLVDVFRRSVSV
jgi:hypothetical protein